MNSHSHPPTRNRNSKPCRFYNHGHCRFGDRCKFSHDAVVQSSPQLIGNNTLSDELRQPQCRDHTSSDLPSSTPSHDTSDARPRSKRGEVTCRAWEAGTCTKGSNCRYAHDIEKPEIESLRSHRQKPFASSRPAPSLTEEGPSTSFATALSRVEQNLREAERIREQEAEAAVARERANAIAREEAAKTISQVVYGSIVTYSAGLDVPNLIPGFETCTLRVGNLTFDVKENDIRALLIGHGFDVDRFHFVIKKKSDRRPEAHIITDIASGRRLASSLDDQEDSLEVELSTTNSLEGMSAATGQSSEILTISWHAPSARYVAQYVDIATANAKVKELNRSMYGGRRIKVEMNTPPPGRIVPNLRLNAIKINNLPPTVTDEDVITFTGSFSVKRLPAGGIFGVMDIASISRLVRNDIEGAVSGGLRQFDDPPTTCSQEGTVSARAHFSSWDEAHAAYTRLSGKRYGNQTVWLRLPDPMYFTLVIPMEQYKAQKTQWNSLSSSIKDRKACTLNVRELGNVVRIQLSGSVKEATGALKVRVENLARGEKVDGWHRSLGISGNKFVLRVYSETGAYLRADWKRQSLKVYGMSGAVDQAREMIKSELERLASLDYTVTVPQHSIGFFVREGIQQLKETLGENNVRFAMAPRKITVSGGEEARYALDRLVTLSRTGNGNGGLPNTAQDSQICPICYDNVASPHQLGCGHTYCVACLRHYITSALESDQLPLTCLGDETRCRVPIAIPTIQLFLPPASFNRLLEAAFDVYVAKHPEEFKHCKTPDCTQIYRAAQATGRAFQTLQCPSCFSAVCNGCHEEAHDGLSCAEGKARRDPAEQERLNDTWIASQGGRVKKCPRCSVPIEKTEGCNHMTCLCGAHICWRCMSIFTEETIYVHMRAAHGSIHDEGPAVPVPALPVNIGIPVDVDEQRELWRQAELRRVAAYQNANAPRPAREQDPNADWMAAIRAQQRWREEEERMERVRRQRELEEWQERRVREQRQLREAEERRRAQRAQQSSGGWGCTIM